jgi:HEPN domain-containing protein
MSPKKKDKLSGWYKVADKDILAAKVLLQHEPMFYEILCFHCQQVAEKYLKGLIAFYDEEPPKVHDIRQLIAIVLLKDETVMKIADAVALNDYAVRFRYPDHMEIDDIEIAKKNHKSR